MLNNNAVTIINLVLVTIILSGSMYFSRQVSTNRFSSIVGVVQASAAYAKVYVHAVFAPKIFLTEGFGWIFGAHYRRDRKEALLVRLTTAFRMNGLPDPYPSCIRSRE